MVTSRVDVLDRVVGLELGADEYRKLVNDYSVRQFVSAFRDHSRTSCPELGLAVVVFLHLCGAGFAYFAIARQIPGEPPKLRVFIA